MNYQVQSVVLVASVVVGCNMDKHEKIKKLLTEVITKTSEKFISGGGSMREVLKGEMKDKVLNK